MEMTFANIGIALLLIAGGIAIQFYLSGRQSKWPGLVLPIFWFIYSLIMVLSFASLGTESVGYKIWVIAILLLRTNIPTWILLGIYLFCRNRRKSRDEIDKTRIQDL